MIVDDSPVARAILSRMIEAYPEFEVAAAVGGAGEAVETLKRSRIDIVLLDVEMPGTSGLDALPDILAHGRGARVLVVSSHCAEGAEAAVRALAAGAADILPKPGAGAPGERFSALLAERLRRLASVETHVEEAAPDVVPPALPLRPMGEGRLGCIAIGASTGGFHSVAGFLKALPASVAVPILVTQHLPAAFMPIFARQLESASGRRAQIAADGVALRPREIVVAPGDAHLKLVEKGAQVCVALDRSAAASGCMPAVDVMLAAASERYGRGAVGVVLSGMGRDGLAGARAIVAGGGTMLVQDPATSAVWGMPRAVAEAGLASAVSPPAELARRIGERMECGAWT
jgi:two-component system chemotaxis response regulator CheB